MDRIRRFLPLALLAALASASAGDEDGPRPAFLDDFSARLDIRAIFADGERTWLKDAFGKTRFGNGQDAEARLALANAALVWHPQVMDWGLQAYVHAQATPANTTVSISSKRI